MIYTSGTIAISGNTVTGTGTDFSAPLSLIRVGCTLIAVSDPIQIFTITEIKSGTELSVTPSANPAIPAGTKYTILLSDSISVDGLAQDVAETLRYYQSQETEVAEALEWSQDHIADKIGLGADHRNWPDCNDPTGYIGFCRAVEGESRNFPSIASGEIYLVGWLARGDNAVINGCFVGTISLSLYTYRYNPSDNTIIWAKQAKQGDSPTFENVVVERVSDLEVTNGGAVRSVLKGSDGAQITGGLFYSEIRGDNKSYTTISNHRGDKNAYAAVTEDGDFVLSNGDFIGRTARLYSDVNRPLILESQFPTIRFLETDKPEGSPGFSFIVDSGNWRIEKDHYSDHSGENCISYSHSENSISVPKFKADVILPPNNIDGTKVNLRIPYTGMANPVEFGAPAGAEANKYYPVIFQFPGWIGSEILAEITVSTASKLGDDYPNNNSVHLWFRNRGWSDCGTVAFGHYRACDSNEVAINCVRTSAKNYQNYAAVYVMGSAFPVKLSATVGTEVIIPTSDFTPAPASDAPTFKWGISNTNEGLGLDEVGIIGNTLNFSSGLSGFYCSDIFRTFDGIPYASTGYNNQKWTGLQDFTTTRINSSDFSRRLKLEAAETAKFNSSLSLWGSDSRPSVFEYNWSNPSTDEGAGFGYYCQLNTDNSVLFYVNGVVNCVTLNQSSDRDLKDNIQVIGDATEAIRKMNGYTYTLKENGLPYAGVIAQEVMEALPEAVGSFTHYGKALQGPTIDGNELREETRYLNVDYAAVTGLLVQVARETDNRVTELEEENASLRANIAVMDERIAKLEALVRQLTGSEE
ncbi:tail fiber domain-containing protein [Escherichia coli]|uniref:tail fiber domain-containing protein n=1 Tax=Escherichia coli TaxID=562 RepID=UPI0018B0E608|nr:tail fiber domain-containing protein [Escherichia coli]MBF9525407.1 tail fiber domain-containing protein [Escherichia coli]